MVELAHKRRRIGIYGRHGTPTVATTTTVAPAVTAARYPLPCLFSALIHRQAPQNLAVSTQSVVVMSHPKPLGPGVNAITGDHYTLDLNSITNNTFLNKTPVRLAEEFHDQNAISHLAWNQRGTTLASADETGKIALWDLGSASDQWTLAYSVDLHQPLAALLWLNTDRLYDLSPDGDTFSRTPLEGPRNPFGHFAFVVVTVHGEVSVHYQRGGKIFSSFSTVLPNTGRMGGSGHADIGCFGMSLIGADNWTRISHASMALDHDGDIYLATHHVDSRPMSVHVYKISVCFPGISTQGAVLCRPLVKLRLTASNLSSSLGNITNAAISQLLLVQKKSGIQLVVGFANEDAEGKYTGLIGRWMLQNRTLKIPGDVIARDIYSGLAMNLESMNLEFLGGVRVEERFITSMTKTRHGWLVIGLSDGSIHVEGRSDDEPGLLRSQSAVDVPSIGPSYWQAADAQTFSDGDPDPVAALAMSPNETHIFCILSSNKLGVIRVTDVRTEKIEPDNISMINKALKLSLLNQIDDLDIVSELIRINGLPENSSIAEKVIQDVLTSYQIYCQQNQVNPVPVAPSSALDPNDDKSLTLRDWSLPQLGRAYGLALGTYRRLPCKTVQYTNLCKAIQLPVILECFIGSCKSNFSDIDKVLSKINGQVGCNYLGYNIYGLGAMTISEEKATLEFETSSLWSLMALTTWTLDFVRWILKKWNVLFHCKRPKNSKFMDIAARPSHAVLLIHKESRSALCKVLVMINEFVRYTTSTTFDLPNLPESAPLLLRYANHLLQNEPIALKDMLAFLNALRAEEADNKDSWSLLLHSKLPSNKVDNLRKITADFSEKFALPAVYLERDSTDIYDVIQKRRIPPATKHLWTCVRCHQYAMPRRQVSSDPCSHALWYRTLGRRCVCGGLFTEWL
ncbi:hypothetical protein BX666DRAFT_2000266 [Dichotomocladium elegans]|nr:hypothetical protein BX666DRAFT_2000266 [Dichotomocladium elegans]